MKDRKTIFLPEIGQPREMSYGDDARKFVISLMDELSVPQNERPIMLGEVDELPERFRTKRERLKSLGVRISESCDGDNTLLLEVPNGIKLDFPIFLLEVSLCAIQPNRNIKIRVGEGAMASFVLGSPVPALYALSPVMSSLDVEAKTGSTVRLAMLHSYLNEMELSSSSRIKIGSGATVEASILTLKAGHILRVEGDVEVAENGSFRLSETSLLEDDNLKASWVHVKLTGPNARAELNSSDFNFDSSETRTAFFVEVMAGAQNAAIQPNRNIKIRVGEGAMASFVLGSPVPALYALSPVMSSLDVEAKTGSTVRLAMLHSYLNEMELSSSSRIKIGSGATVEASILTLKAGHILRVEGDVEVAENGSFRLSETSLLEDDNLKASWVHVKLTGPNARAELNSSDFNFDSSETRTAFFVEVMAGAQNAAGSIFSSGVNFSENATQLFLPGLITHEEDVDLHHGASSGKWTAEQVEYLRTRGLSLHDIAILLVDSILSASMYPLLTDKLVEYTKRYVARIFRGRRLSF